MSFTNLKLQIKKNRDSSKYDRLIKGLQARIQNRPVQYALTWITRF